MKNELKFYKQLSLLFLITTTALAILVIFFMFAIEEKNAELDQVYNVSDYILEGWNQTLNEWIDCKIELLSIQYNVSEEELWYYYNSYLEAYEDEI